MPTADSHRKYPFYRITNVGENWSCLHSSESVFQSCLAEQMMDNEPGTQFTVEVVEMYYTEAERLPPLPEDKKRRGRAT